MITSLPDMYTKFPFTAIVGQDEMKLALILNAIDPSIGGLILMGDRGTGKSTAVRSMTEILPVIEVTLDDPFNSHPSSTKPIGADTYKFTTQTYVPTIFKKPALIELPLGATEDKVCGSINVEKTLAQNSKVFEPGLLAKANRGILYIDEVNLLEDHLVDILLDSAACGWNTVERDGISIQACSKWSDSPGMHMPKYLLGLLKNLKRFGSCLMILDFNISGCFVRMQKISKSKSFLADLVIDQISASAFKVLPVRASVIVVEFEVRQIFVSP